MNITIIVTGIMSCIFLFQTLSIDEESIKTTARSSPSCENERNQSKCTTKHTVRKSFKHHVMILGSNMYIYIYVHKCKIFHVKKIKRSINNFI